MPENIDDWRIKYVIDLLFNVAGLEYNKLEIKEKQIYVEVEPGLPIVLEMDDISYVLRRLTRKEEKEIKSRDKYNRFLSCFSSEDSKAPSFDILVKKILNLAYEKAKELEIPLIHKCFWPNNYSFAICLTHDIDTLRPTLRYDLATLLKLLRQKKIGKAIKKVVSITKRENPWDPIRISQIEKKYDATSTFFFLIGGTSKFDIRPLNERYLIKVINKLKKHNFEIGLHTSYSSFEKLDEILIEKKRLERIANTTVVGVRQHYLLFNAFETLNFFENVGFLYDSTLGFADSPGFRSGISFPFYPCDIDKKRIFNILEIPLVVMDTTFSEYLNMSPHKAKKEILNLMHEILKNNGLFTLLWHNNSFDIFLEEPWIDVYESILKFGLENGAWLTNAFNIYTWWTKRMSTKIKFTKKNREKIVVSVNGFENLYGKVILPDEWALYTDNNRSFKYDREEIFSIPLTRRTTLIFKLR